MALTPLQMYRNGTDGAIFMSPAKPSYSVRFKTLRSPKKLGSIQTENVVQEIIATALNQVNVGNNTADDAISVRIRVSGSVLSEAAVNALATAIASSVPAWTAEHVMVGYNPVTPPSV